MVPARGLHVARVEPTVRSNNQRDNVVDRSSGLLLASTRTAGRACASTHIGAFTAWTNTKKSTRIHASFGKTKTLYLSEANCYRIVTKKSATQTLHPDPHRQRSRYSTDNDSACIECSAYLRRGLMTRATNCPDDSAGILRRQARAPCMSEPLKQGLDVVL
jgi:hypothetical protein